MTNRWLGSAAVLPAMVAGQAMAASPVYNWTGFYVGGNVGGAWGRSNANTTVDCNQPSYDPSTGTYAYICGNESPAAAVNAPVFNAAGAGTINSSGFTGGAQVGYNLQYQGLVYGLETDFGAFQLLGSTQRSGVYPSYYGFPPGTLFNISSSVSTDWLYTFRGRLGVPVVPNLLVYATGGLAVTRISANTTYSDQNPWYYPGPGAANYGNSGVRAGWTIGAGLEWGIAPQWSVKAEYLYLNFGSISANGLLTTPRDGYRQGLGTTTDLTAQIARIGVNRHF